MLTRGKQSSLRPERLAFFEHRHAATVFELQGARSQMRVRTLSLSLQFSSFLRSYHLYSDEFAEVKAVKLLRRGRRLQQVESVSTLSFVYASFVYFLSAGPSTAKPSMRMAVSLPPPLSRLGSFLGSNQNSSHRLSSVDSTSSVSHTPPRSPTLALTPCTDPIIDPSEFCARFFEFSKGNCNALGIPGQLIAMLLAVWAASFGVNEYGIEELHHREAVIHNRREAANEMIQEILHLIDIHGILRKPTWDGVRALHLLLPLTQGP